MSTLWLNVHLNSRFDYAGKAGRLGSFKAMVLVQAIRLNLGKEPHELSNEELELAVSDDQKGFLFSVDGLPPSRSEEKRYPAYHRDLRATAKDQRYEGLRERQHGFDHEW
jgi:hypothetical protein